MKPIYLSYLNRLDVEELKLSGDEILMAIESSLETQDRGEAVIEPRVPPEPRVANGHFNVLRGALRAPIDSAGVKVVVDIIGWGENPTGLGSYRRYQATSTCRH